MYSPLERGNTSTQTFHYQEGNSISTLPSGEGAGVCDVRAQPPKPKAVTQNLTDTTSPKQQQKHLIPTHAPHRHTPLNNYLITNKKIASQSPL